MSAFPEPMDVTTKLEFLTSTFRIFCGTTSISTARADEVLGASLERMANEADILNKLANGEDTSNSFPKPELEFMS